MESLRFLKGRPLAPRRLQMFLVAFAACGLLLFATTWKLWTPVSGFPQVPLIALAGRLPRWLDWLALTGLFVSLLLLVCAALGCLRNKSEFTEISRTERGSLITFAGCVVLLFLTNQHRLQPWAFQYAIFAVVLSALPVARAWVLLRCVVISIYFWSALAKLDYSFAETVGQQFLETLVGFVGMSVEPWTIAFRHAAALVFPLAELFIAVGLCLPLSGRTWLRRALLGLMLSTHSLLILSLSPLGMNHQPGVIAWNIWFLVQAWFLVSFPREANISSVETESHRPEAPLHRELGGVLAEFFVAAVILLPALNLVNRYDHWLAWGLYAPRNSRATLYVQSDAVDDLTPATQQYIEDRQTEEGWRQVNLDQWSLDEVAAPIYPQARFQVAVAGEVIRRHQLQDSFQLVVEGPADRWSGRRKQAVIRNLTELAAQRDRFVLGAEARN